MTGNTRSSDFPTTAGAFDTSANGGLYDASVAKLDPTGAALVYSTYLGGSSTDEGLGIAVDASGSAYVTGITQSSDFPNRETCCTYRCLGVRVEIPHLHVLEHAPWKPRDDFVRPTYGPQSESASRS